MKKIILSGIALSFAAALNASTALADFTVATVGPITGDLAALGEQYKQGATMAVNDINAAGGINGEKLTLEIGDDACVPEQATRVAEQMASKGVKFVAGHLCSGSSIPASKVYGEEGILMISPASTNPVFTDEGGWNVHRVCGRDDAQGAVAGAYLAKTFAGKKVAIIDDKSAYGKGLADETSKAMQAAGLAPAIAESINPGEKDYSALVSKLKDAGVEAIYFGGYHPEGALILKQMREQGSKAQMLSGDSMNNVEFWTIAGEAAEGMIFTFAPEPRNFPEAKEIVGKFKAGGFDPEGYTLYTYASFQMYQQAATAVGSNDSKKIAEWLRAGNPVKTVLGELKLDAKGDLVGAKYVWYRFSKGSYAEDLSIQ
ncbi:MAG: branched-chain amino acid ABC transporter substrate-binding protein [Phyllobacteriaceae bacterium]|jgi:branched-chain amino acid transport system substrate-binding protein|nr:branched-chain amino acid ABC transporter substrate-binding protein [Phyllobacteriaceae bacterium]